MVVRRPGQIAAVVVCVLLVIGLLLALVLTQTITKPILSLAEATGRIAEGQFEVDVPAGGAYEVDILATSFRRMTTKLHTSQEQVFDSGSEGHRANSGAGNSNAGGS